MARPRTPTAADPKRPLSSRISPEHQGHFCVRPMVGRMSCRCATCPRWLMRRGMGARVQPMTRACVTLDIRGEKSATRVVRSMECRSHSLRRSCQASWFSSPAPWARAAACGANRIRGAASVYLYDRRHPGGSRGGAPGAAKRGSGLIRYRAVLFFGSNAYATAPA